MEILAAGLDAAPKIRFSAAADATLPGSASEAAAPSGGACKREFGSATTPETADAVAGVTSPMGELFDDTADTGLIKFPK
ncbi:hypothetical protein CI15_20335 [Paraburkholderia monticola]|uniref:Uncharacterized protein n=1 Tax=Paraburkholderia monticola TaxID=1399968 RepID=A0A149PKG1_9BURK|nr:hypothetical protein CI15_20335 [Paraburkholderia monticola]